MTAKIEVPIKPAIKSWGFMGSAVAAGATLFVGVQTALQTPGGLAALCGNLQDKYGGIALVVLGIGGSLYGNIKRPDVFLRSDKLKEATQNAANKVAKELTLTEAAQTTQQGWNAITAPADERTEKMVQWFVDTQKRLTAQDQVLAEIKSVVTAQQFPPLADYPDRTDLPSDPRLRAQREAPQMATPPMPGFEADVLQSSDGVLEGY